LAAKQSWWHRHPVLSNTAGGVLTAAILAGVAQVAGLINLPSWWLAVRSAAAGAWVWAIAPMPTPHWLLVLMTIAVLAWLALFVVLFGGLRRDQQKALDVYSYVTDDFLNMRWRWSWQGNTPSGLVPFCLTCDMQIDVAREGGYAIAAPLVFPCRICGTVQCRYGDGSTDLAHVQREVALLIQRNVRQRLLGEQEKDGS
jgi:hypothetical protein